MDEIRRQLAELMESVDDDAGGKSRKSFTDSDVCKYHLTGLCPHDLFQNTKQYMGPCPNVHSDDLREQYLKAREYEFYGYEETTLRYLKPQIDECDRRIARQTIGGRCDTQDKASESIEASARREVDALEVQITDKMKEAEALGNNGDVAGSIKIMDEINQLNLKKKMALEEKSSKVEEAKSMYFQKLKPCDACGALLSEKDGENRLNEHFLGRIHLGFEAMRKHIDGLNDYLTKIAPGLPRHSGGSRHNNTPSSTSPEEERRRRRFSLDRRIENISSSGRFSKGSLPSLDRRDSRHGRLFRESPDSDRHPQSRYRSRSDERRFHDRYHNNNNINDNNNSRNRRSVERPTTRRHDGSEHSVADHHHEYYDENRIIQNFVDRRRRINRRSIDRKDRGGGGDDRSSSRRRRPYRSSSSRGSHRRNGRSRSRCTSQCSAEKKIEKMDSEEEEGQIDQTSK